MWGSAVIGLLFGVTYVACSYFAPQPAGAICWWGFFAVQLAWGAVLIWRRTGLPFATAAAAIAGATMAMVAGLAAAGHVFPSLPPIGWVLFVLGLVAGPVCYGIESRVNRSRWTRWTEYQKDKNAWDQLLWRHIPDLRDNQT